MEQILVFEFVKINTKDNKEYIKTLMITTSEVGGYNGYTSFSSAEDSINSLIITPDFRDSLSIKSITYVGKFGNNARYAAVLEFFDVDGKPQVITVVYNKIY